MKLSVENSIVFFGCISYLNVLPMSFQEPFFFGLALNKKSSALLGQIFSLKPPCTSSEVAGQNPTSGAEGGEEPGRGAIAPDSTEEGQKAL